MREARVAARSCRRGWLETCGSRPGAGVPPAGSLLKLSCRTKAGAGLLGSGDCSVCRRRTALPPVLGQTFSLVAGPGGAARPGPSTAPAATEGRLGKAGSAFWSPMKKEVAAGSPGALGEGRPFVHATPSWGPAPNSEPRPPSDPLASLRLSGSKSSWPKRQPGCSLADSGGPGPLLLVASRPPGLSARSLGSCGSRRRWRTGGAPSGSPAPRPGLSSVKTRAAWSEWPRSAGPWCVPDA